MPRHDNPGATANPDTPPPPSRLIPAAMLESAKARIVSAAADLAPYMERVEMPLMQATRITAVSAFSAVLRGSRNSGK